MKINDIIERYPINVMEHAERIMNLVRPFGKDYMVIALLHDILEDTEVTTDDLFKALPYHCRSLRWPCLGHCRAA